jgi:hypothetical protein
MPIHLKINSDEDEFIKARFGFIAVAVALDGEHGVSVMLSMPFLRFRVYPSVKKKIKEKTKKSNTQKKAVSIQSKLKQTKLLIKIIWHTMGKFNVKRFYLDLDTRDIMLNSYLFPVFYMISEKPHIDLNINYTGNFHLVLDTRNNLLNIVLIIIRNLFKRS